MILQEHESASIGPAGGAWESVSSGPAGTKECLNWSCRSMSVLALVLQEEYGSGSIGPAGGAWEAAGEEAAMALGLLHPPCCTHS